jgi:tetratricopeptide (TPR) repeat protein
MAKKKRKSSVKDSAAVTTLRREERGEQERVDPAPVSYKRRLREMHTGFYAPIPAVLALLTSLNSLWNQFAFDDKQQVLGNEFIKRLSNLPLLFTSSVWAFSDSLQSASRDPYYRPMFMGLFTVNYSIFGTAAWGWHLVNVLVHVGVTLLVWLVVKEMTDRKGVATIAAALFAVHPAHSESVAWISGVTDPLMALFVLTSFYFYLRFKKTGRKSLMALGLVLFLPAALTKETAFALPLVIACCEIFYFRGAQGLWKRTASAATIALLFCVPAVVYFVMRYIALGRLLAPPGSRFESITAVLTGPLVILKYLGLMLVPIGYNLHHYTAPVGSFLKFSFIGPLILVGAMAAALVLSKSRDLWFAGSWFLIWLLPPLAGLSLFEPEYFVQERYLYLPSVGVCLALALGIERLATLRMFKLSKEMTATAVTAAVLILFSFVYIKQNSVWMNTLSLFQHCADSNPGLTEPIILLSTEYYVEGNRQKAEEETRRALELRPDCLDALINLSQFAYNDGKLDSAIEYLENARSALTDGPQHRGYLARICGDLGTLYAERKDFELAESFLRRAVEVMPYPLNWFALGNYYFDRGRYAEALEMYELTEAATSKKYAPLRLKLARTYDRLGQTQRARDEYNKYLDLAPNAKDRSEIFRRLSQL